MLLRESVKAIKQMFNGTKTIAQSLPSALLYCVTLKRSGMSAMETTSSIIRECGEIKIPTGKNADGTDNMINAYTYIVVKNIFGAIKHSSVSEGALPPFSISFTGEGMSAGGTVPVTGYNNQWVKFRTRTM